MSIRSEKLLAIFSLTFALNLICEAVARPDEPVNTFQVRRAIEAFCCYEFRGNTSDERAKQIVFTLEREKRERKRVGEALPWVIFWDSAPLVIVESYKVVRVEPAGEGKATAYVEYDVIAESKGKGNVVTIKNPEDMVKYHLKWSWKDTRWQIVDPPIPRISREALIRHYDEYFDSLGPDWIKDPRLTDVQRKSYADRVKTLDTLRSLTSTKDPMKDGMSR